MTTFSFKYLSMLHFCTAPANITSPKLGPNPKQIVHMLQAQTFYHANHELLICFTFRCNSTHWYYGVMRVCYASQQFSISPFPSRKKSGNFVGWFFLLFHSITFRKSSEKNLLNSQKEILVSLTSINSFPLFSHSINGQWSINQLVSCYIGSVRKITAPSTWIIRLIRAMCTRWTNTIPMVWDRG